MKCLVRKEKNKNTKGNYWSEFLIHWWLNRLCSSLPYCKISLPRCVLFLSAAKNWEINVGIAWFDRGSMYNTTNKKWTRWGCSPTGVRLQLFIPFLFHKLKSTSVISNRMKAGCLPEENKNPSLTYKAQNLAVIEVYLHFLRKG